MLSFLFLGETLFCSEIFLKALQNSDTTTILNLIRKDIELLKKHHFTIAQLALQHNHPALRRQVLFYWHNIASLNEEEKKLVSQTIASEVAYLRNLKYHSDEDIESIRSCLALILRHELTQNFYDVLLFIAYPLLDIRKDSYKVLAHFKDDRMFPFILRLAVSEDPLERTYALDALYYIKDERTVPLLLNALKDKNKSVRYYAIRTLESMERADAIPYFIRLVQEDVDNEIRIKAIQVLAKAGVRHAYGIIAKTVSDTSPEVRREAVRALLEYNDVSAAYYISEQLAREDENSLKEQQIKALVALKNSGGMAGLNKIILKEENTFIKLWAIYAAGYIADARAFDAVYLALNDPNYEIRIEAAHAIGFFRNKKAVARLLELIYHDTEYSVKAAALFSLQKINSEESYPDIFDIANDHLDYKIRLQAKDVMRNLLYSRYKK